MNRDDAVEQEHMLRARRLGIDTKQEPVIYMREDCTICRSEGFNAHSRVRVIGPQAELVATLNVVKGDLLDHGQAGFSESAWWSLQLNDCDLIRIHQARPVESFAYVRGKLYGNRMTPAHLNAVVSDIVAGRYTDVQISAFVAAASGHAFDNDETVALTQGMLAAGDRLHWAAPLVVDKHCVGGLPGNRTTPLVVATVAAAGLTMPKTSSRAITSPAGTADTMETMAPVNLDLKAMRRVVDEEGGCVVWGGSVRLSPADDLLIRIERALDIDSDAQLVASVLSKKAAAGSTHVIIDIPVGPTAKVRSQEAAAKLADQLKLVGSQIGLTLETILTDGTQPVGRGIGPALEARDVLAVLQGLPEAPCDLKERALLLAGRVLELGGVATANQGSDRARHLLESGQAWEKFLRICEAQGGFREPPTASYHKEIIAEHAGIVTEIDNRRLSRLAKLAGAPDAPAAGIELQAHVGWTVERHAPLFIVHAETRGELLYALNYLKEGPNPFVIGARD